jgi:CBS domain-containing protein
MDQIDDVLRVKGSRVYTIAPTATVFEAISAMVEFDVGSLLVMDAMLPVGIITERDYLRKVAVLGRTSRETRVVEIMSRMPHAISPGHSVDECLELMTEYRVRHLPVLNHGHLVGIVSVGDLVKHKLMVQDHAIEQLTRYIHGYPA